MLPRIVALCCLAVLTGGASAIYLAGCWPWSFARQQPLVGELRAQPLADAKRDGLIHKQDHVSYRTSILWVWPRFSEASAERQAEIIRAAYLEAFGGRRDGWVVVITADGHTLVKWNPDKGTVDLPNRP